MTAATPPAIEARRPGLRAWTEMTVVEAKMVARDTAGMIIPLGLPLLILVMNGLGADREPQAALGGLPVLDAILVPMALGMVVALIGLVNMPAFVATYRKTGVLRRLGVTPAHPAMVLVAQVLVSVAQMLAGIAIALGVALTAFGVTLPGNLLGAVLVFVLVVAATNALGMLIAALAPTANSAIAIGLVAFLVTMALGGGFGGRENLPGAVATVGQFLPYGAGVEGLSATWMGNAPEVAHLGALAAVAVVAGIAAAKLFRWE